jgi:hypothetical protein
MLLGAPDGDERRESEKASRRLSVLSAVLPTWRYVNYGTQTIGSQL